MAEGPTIQISIRVPPEWLETAEKLAAELSRPGLEVSRTEAFRAALAFGLEHMPANPRGRSKSQKRLPPKGQKAGLAPSFLVPRYPTDQSQNNEVSAMKTSASTRVPQDGARKAPVRSTPARARSTPAKPLRPVDAKAPTPQPGDDFAPLFAGLVALCQAHEGARSAPARALLAALVAILDLCRRYLAAPADWRLAAGASEGDDLGMFAGLSLVAPAPPPAPAAPPARPRLTPAHRSLVCSAEGAFIGLARAQQAAACLALDLESLPADYWNAGAMSETGEALHSALSLLTSHLCEVAHELADTGSDATPLEHALALAALSRTAADDTESIDARDTRDARAALARFNRSSDE